MTIFAHKGNKPAPSGQGEILEIDKILIPDSLMEDIKGERRRVVMSADANMAYDSKNKRVRALLRDLDKQLYKHEARQGARMQDWGFVGDLEHVEEQLTELLRFIGGGTRASRVSKTYEMLIRDPAQNRRLWTEIEDMAGDVFDAPNWEEEASSGRTHTRIQNKSRELARMYGDSSVDIHELAMTIEEMIWEEYHNQ